MGGGEEGKLTCHGPPSSDALQQINIAARNWKSGSLRSLRTLHHPSDKFVSTSAPHAPKEDGVTVKCDYVQAQKWHHLLQKHEINNKPFFSQR